MIYDTLDMEGFLFVVYWLTEIVVPDDYKLVPDGNYTVLDIKQIIYN